MRAVLYCSAVIITIWLLSASTSAKESKALKKGIKATTKLLSTLSGAKGAAALKSFASLATKIGPYLGALGPMMSIISAFIPRESAEMKLLKNEFAKIDAKFDRVFSQFDEVKTLVQKSTMKVQYSKYERRIITLSGYLQDISQEEDENVYKFLKDMFLESYEQYYGDSADYLRLGILKTGPFATNIPDVLIKSTEGDLKQINMALKSTLSLILQGIKIENAYCAFKNQIKDLPYLERDWDRKIKILLSHMDSLKQKVKDNFLQGARKDAEKMLAEYQEKTSKQLSNDLYTLLRKKYKWRYWFVFAYNAKEIKGDKEHWIVTCGGFWIKDKHGKHLAVSSVDKSSQGLSNEMKGSVKLIMQKIMLRESSNARERIEEFYPQVFEKHCSYGYVYTHKRKTEEYKPTGDYTRLTSVSENGGWYGFVFS